ncbi:MAG: IS200/IS605 family element transposase accessory protein TnpB [Chloroflexi bacterium]|nr:MAG: IS200/IS605 family element transposase accessory protein TnpB [Chloroflexota bacterium]
MYAWKQQSIPSCVCAKPHAICSNWSRSYPMKAWWRRLIGLHGKNWLVFRKSRKSQMLPCTKRRKEVPDVKRSHVIRLHPTPEQEVYFRKACGVARHAYNWALARWKDSRAEGKWAKIKDLKAEYNRIKGEQFPWCSEVTKCAPEQEFRHLGQAFDNYWRMKKEGTGKIMSAVISSRAGWWFVSIAVEVEHDVPTHNGGAVGIDLGIKTLATCSDGAVFENQKHYRQSLGRIKSLSKGLSRKGEGSQNWGKHARKLAKAHYRIACQRQGTLHKMTTSLARRYALVGLEDLNTKGMLSNHCLAQAVSDASFFEVKRQLLYKAEQYGGYVQLVSQWYPSSKICHACGWIKEDLTLDERVWVCEQCGVITERDLNAALNIRTEALRLLTDVPVVASSGQKFACGAESAGSRCVESETFCDEAGTRML